MWVTNLYNGLAFLLSGPLNCELCISKKQKKKSVSRAAIFLETEAGGEAVQSRWVQSRLGLPGNQRAGDLAEKGAEGSSEQQTAGCDTSMKALG